MATYAEEIESRVIHPRNATRRKRKGVFEYVPIYDSSDMRYNPRNQLVGCKVVVVNAGVREGEGQPALLEAYYDGTGIFRPNCLSAIGQYSPRYAVKDVIRAYYHSVEVIENEYDYRSARDYYDQRIEILRRKPVRHRYTHLFSTGKDFETFLTNKFNVGANNA